MFAILGIVYFRNFSSLSFFLIQPWHGDYQTFNITQFSFMFIILTVITIVFIEFMISSALLLALSLITSFLLSSSLVFMALVELGILPMMLFLYSGKSGERFLAIQMFIIYTASFSILSLLYIVNLQSLGQMFFFNTLLKESQTTMISLWLFAFLLVKFPAFFFHWWLPRVHVEASTIGSMILAAVLLKLGSYAYFHFFFFLKTQEVFFGFMIIGMLVAAAMLFSSVDMKVVIATFSVVHMTMLMSSLMVLNTKSVEMNMALSLSHALIAASLFLLVGSIYDSTGSRSLILLRGELTRSSISLILLLLFMNVGLPPALNFFSELLMVMNGTMFSLLFGLFLTPQALISGMMTFFLACFFLAEKDCHKNKGILPMSISINLFMVIYNTMVICFAL